MLRSRTFTLFTSSINCLKPRNTCNYISSRNLITLKQIQYTATAEASGAGRNGHVKSNDLKFDMALPKELGGNGKGTNPEQLFAMGYSACFLGAIQAVAKNLGKEEMAKKATVRTKVHIGAPHDLPGFGLAVDIKVKGVDKELLEAAHKFCPYSRALAHGISVNVSTD